MSRGARTGGRGLARVIAARLGQLVVVLLAVTIAVFAVTQVAPGDAARLRLGPRASEQAVRALRAELGLDRNLAHQYADYLGRIVRGDLGETIAGVPVTTVLAERVPETAALLSAGLVATLLLAVPLAAVAAWRRDRPADHGIRMLALLALFAPSFWIGFVLIRWVALPTGWFPVAGLGDGALAFLQSLVLPALTIALAAAPVLVRSLRSSLVDVLDADYVAAARSVGVRGLRLARRHVLRNAAAPAVALIAFQLGFLLFGAVVVEYTFDIPGLGSALVDGAARRDVFLVQGVTLVFAVVVVAAAVAGELLAAVLDPRASRR